MRYALQMSAVKASKIYRISKTTIRKWMKTECGAARAGMRIGRPLCHPELEAKIKDYILQQMDKGIGVTSEDVRTFGKSLMETECPGFKASRSWLLGFYRRHGLGFDGKFLRVRDEMEEGEEQGSDNEFSGSGEDRVER